MIDEEVKKFGAACNELSKEFMKLFKIKEIAEKITKILDKAKENK